MSVIFAVANQKGGVGKTTTAVNLGAALVERGRRVLLVDSDAQANLTGALGLPKESPSTYDVLLGEASITQARRPVKPGLDVLPATPDMAGSEVDLFDLPQRERRLELALTAVLGEYDYVFVDCPPSLGLLTLNALVAAGGVLAPVQCEYLALEGLTQLLATLRRVREALNPRLQHLLLLMTMYDARTGLSRHVVSEVQRHFPTLFLRTLIPRTVRLGEAPSYGKTILDYDGAGRGAAAYRLLAEEFEARAHG